MQLQCSDLLQSVVDQFVVFYNCGDTLESHTGVGVKNTILTAVKRPFLSLAISVT